MTSFYFDENIAPRIASMIRGWESPRHRIAHITEVFGYGTADRSWLKALASAEERVVVISQDRAILSDRDERRALLNAGLVFFCLGPGWMKLPSHAKARQLLNVWPNLVDVAARAAPPVLYEVPVKGRQIRRLETPLGCGDLDIHPYLLDTGPALPRRKRA